MKSRISLFNKGVSLNLLKRCWPLWSTYFAVLLLMVPAAAAGRVDMLDEGELLNYTLLASGCGVVKLSIAASMIAAMAMYSYLYSARSCGMMNALPLRRETMFCTAFLTGIMPLIAADLLTALITLVTLGKYLYISALLKWLGLVVMGNVSFYGFAVLCAVLTGNIVVMPVVYGVLNLTAFVAENCVRNLLAMFVYGMSADECRLLFLSPMAAVIKKLDVAPITYIDAEGMVQWKQNEYALSGMGMMAAYCAAGLACAALALLIYRRRHMESAGDVVAVPVLRPVFKYCMAFGTAVVFAKAVDMWISIARFSGTANAAVILLLMLAGAFIGYFAAEMLLQKTVRVFGGKWKGYIIVCLVLTVLTAAWEFDMFGYERRVPDIDEVEYVMLDNLWSNGGTIYYEPENIQKVIDLHQHIIQNKRENEGTDERYFLPIRYTMKDGSSLERAYIIANNDVTMNEPDSDINWLQEMVNLQEAIYRRMEMPFQAGEENISYATINFTYVGSDGETITPIELSREQAWELYSQCILKDIEDGNFGREWVSFGDAYYDTVTSVYIQLDFFGYVGDSRQYKYISEELGADAENCLRWIAENTDIKVMTQRELQLEKEKFGAERPKAEGAGIDRPTAEVKYG